MGSTQIPQGVKSTGKAQLNALPFLCVLVPVAICKVYTDGGKKYQKPLDYRLCTRYNIDSPKGDKGERAARLPSAAYDLRGCGPLQVYMYAAFAARR